MQSVATHRLDAILAPDYLDGLTTISIDELRSRRTECQAVEVSLSYSRRVVQGRLDIVLAELKHRRDGTTSDLHTLVEELPEILSEKVHAAGFGRMSAFMAPGAEPELDPALVARIDAVADDRRLRNLTEASEEEVEALVDELRSLEVEISAQRRALFERIDALQDELVRRYKSGEADPRSLLA
jgi:hypothetical protein